MEPFCDARVSVFRGNTLEPSDLPDVAIVFGGDDAIHRVLPTLAYSDTLLLVVPIGSSNDFAHCLGIPNRSEALRAWRRYLDRGDNVRTIDLGTVRPMADPAPSPADLPEAAAFTDADPRCAAPSGPAMVRQQLRSAQKFAESPTVIYFSGIAGFGLDAETNRRANRMPGWLRRHGGYILAALGALADYVPPVVRLYSYDACGQETCLSGPMLFTAVGNAPEYGSGVRMLPQAQLDDGQLDLCYVPAMPRSLILRHFYRIYAGTHLLVPRVRYFRTRQVFVESAEPIAIYADGEYLCETPAEISASSKALRVIVP